MSILAIMLVALGLSDLIGGQLRHLNRWNRWAPAVAGLVVVVALAALAGLSSVANLALLAVSGAAVVCWQLSAASAFARDRGHWVPLAIVGAGLTLVLLIGGIADPIGGPLAQWTDWAPWSALAATTPDRLLLITGLLLIQVSTANVFVRLVLSHVGALRPTGPQPADRLRGGRLLGPMERIVIVGLGMAGQLAAASLVIAAKGLIRWPELKHASVPRDHPQFEEKNRTVGIDAVTEYFLVGSFVSWLIALSAIAGAALL